MKYSYRDIYSVAFAIFFSTLIGCSGTKGLDTNSSTNPSFAKQCDQRFSDLLVAQEKTSNRVRLTQNFILTEILNDRVACAKSIANNSDSEAFKDYYVALANYFDFGNQDSYVQVFQALRRYSFDDGGCTIKISNELGSYNHIDCGAIFLLSTFIVLETEHEVFLTRFGVPISHEQAQYIHFSGLQLTLTGLLGAFIKSIDRYGPPKSLIIEERYIPAYLKEVLHVYWALTFRITKAADEASDGEFVIFGNAVGQARKDQTFWSDMELDEYSREMLKTSHDELVRLYYSEAELASGNYLGNNPASYCQARLFIFSLIFKGRLELREILNSRPYEKCLEYHEANWG